MADGKIPPTGHGQPRQPSKPPEPLSTPSPQASQPPAAPDGPGTRFDRWLAHRGALTHVLVYVAITFGTAFLTYLAHSIVLATFFEPTDWREWLANLLTGAFVAGSVATVRQVMKRAPEG